MLTPLLRLAFLLVLLSKVAHAATPAPESLFAPTPPLDISGKHDFPDPGILSDDAASQLSGLCSLEDFRSLPEPDRHVYSFEVWPGENDKLEKKSYTFNFHLGPKGVASEKVAFVPMGGGPNSVPSFARVKEPGTEQYVLKGLGNLDWNGIAEHSFKFDKPVSAFGVVLNSSGDVDLRKFYWDAAKDRNGYPISYTLADGTVVQLGKKDLRGALIKGGTHSFLGVIDRSGRGIVSVRYTLKGLAGNKAQSISMSHLAFATIPKPAVASVINLKSSCDFESADSIIPTPVPALPGLASLEEFHFIVANKRSVYRFDTWPRNSPDMGPTGEFAFDLNGKGIAGQKVTIQATNSANRASLVQTSLESEDCRPYPVLAGLGDIGNGRWAEQTFNFEKPVWAFGVTYRSPRDATLAEVTADGKGYPVSYTLSDGTVVHLGTAGASGGVIRANGKTFVGVIDDTDKGISSMTVRVQGTAKGSQPLFIEELAFALSGPPPGDWTITLNDNFDGDRLDPDVWSTGYRFVDVINNEMQGYVPENVTVANGVCTIKTEQRDCQNTDWKGYKGQAQKFASGAFTSYDKFTQTYGYFEARVRMPKARGAGIWPAFWVLPDRGRAYPDDIRNSYGTKAYGTGIEIDIFEFMPWWRRADGPFPVHMGCIWSYGKVTEQDPAPHGYGAYALENDGWGPKELYFPDLDTKFHTYGLYWSPERLIFYVDSKPVFRVKDPKHVPDVPHYFLFNVAVHRNGWGKGPDKKDPTEQQIIEDMPNRMEIDYFRAYSGILEEAISPSSSDMPTIVRKYSPPPKAAPAAPGPPAASPDANPAPSSTDVPPAPANSQINSAPEG